MVFKDELEKGAETVGEQGFGLDARLDDVLFEEIEEFLLNFS